MITADPISGALERANRRLEGYRAAAASAFAAEPDTAHPIAAAAGGPTEHAMAQTQRLVKHSEQYKHYTGWVYVAINRIATRISGQPAHLGRQLTGARREQARKFYASRDLDDARSAWYRLYGTRLLTPEQAESAPEHVKRAPSEYELVQQHRLLEALKNPNEMMVRASLFLTTVASLELTGRGYWWWPTIKSKLQIWPLPTDWVTPRHSEDGLYSYYEVKPPSRMQEPILLPASEIVPFILPDPSDPHGSVSPVQTQGPAIVTDEAMQMSQFRAQKNGLYPGVLLTIGRHPDVDGKPGMRPVLTRDQRKDVIEAMRAIHEGAVNYGEPFILDGLFEDVKPFTRTPAEMDYLDSGKHTKSRIMQAFGVNPFIAGENVTVGWSQASVADEVFVSNVVNPLGGFMGETVTKKLGDPRLTFWLEEATPRNPELKAKNYAVALAKQTVTKNEFRREVLKLPELEDGTGDETAPAAGGGFGGAARPSQEDEEPEKPPRRPRPPSSRKAPRRAGHLLPRLRRAVEGLFLKQADAGEAALRRALKALFRRMGRAVGREVQRVVSQSPQLLESGDAADTVADMIYRPADWHAALRSAVFRPLAEAVLSGYLAAKALMEERAGPLKSAKEIDPDTGETVSDFAFQELADDEVAWITEWNLPRSVKAGIGRSVAETLSQPYWQKILETTGADIRHTLKRGIDDGWALRKIGRAIAQEVGDASGKRGKRIADTEVTNAVNAGHKVQAHEVEDLGLSVIKVWVTVGDTKVRDEHLAADGQEVKGADGLFDVGGYEVEYPGHYSLPPELRIHCRCTFFTDLEELRPAS